MLGRVYIEKAQARLAELAEGARPDRHEARAVMALAVQHRAIARLYQSERAERLAAETELAAAERERRSDIRAEVMARAAGHCEWCYADLFRSGVEWHHLLGGSGRRRQEEEAETTAAICIPCHRAWHAADKRAFQAALAWAMERRFTRVRSEIERRLTKIMDRERAA